MISIISNELYSSLMLNDTRKILNEILEIFDFINSNSFDIKKTEKIWDSEYNGDILVDWLYSNDEPVLSDLKRELSIQITKAQSFENSHEYELFQEKLSKDHPSYCDFNDKFLFIEDDNNENIHLISSIDKLLKLMRRYISVSPNKIEFFKMLKIYYPNLFFHENVFSSLRNLNTDFSDLLPEIVDHLTALDEFSKENNKLSKSNREKCADFESLFDINCSPESSREKAKLLTFKDGEIDITCECHTKFKKFGRNKNKQDRIYFSFGTKLYEEGRIIVYSIGDHI